MPERSYVPLDNLQPGPIRHWTLPDSLVARIKRFKQTLAEVDPGSLEETIADFCRDGHPETEIAIWESIAAAYQEAVVRDPSMTLSQKRQVFAKLLLQSTEDHPITAAPDHPDEQEKN